jgi:glycerophosphoryl diester phosphodiesterase
MRPHPFLDHPLPIAIAHRGGALEAEENTMPAFERAVGLGYSHVETDVRATSDGVAVLFHDDTLMRMAGRPERVEDLSWAELSSVRLKAGGRVPRLDALLEAYSSLHVNLDTKSDAAVEPMARAIRASGALARVCVGSFSAPRTARLRAALGEGLAWSPARAGVVRILLGGFGLPVGRPRFHALQVPQRHRGIPIVTRSFVRAAQARGLHVHVWTVDQADGIERLLDLGVDGIMTDRPSLLREVLTRRGQWRGSG